LLPSSCLLTRSWKQPLGWLLPTPALLFFCRIVFSFVFFSFPHFFFRCKECMKLPFPGVFPCDASSESVLLHLPLVFIAGLLGDLPLPLLRCVRPKYSSLLIDVRRRYAFLSAAFSPLKQEIAIDFSFSILSSFLQPGLHRDLCFLITLFPRPVAGQTPFSLSTCSGSYPNEVRTPSFFSFYDARRAFFFIRVRTCPFPFYASFRTEA